MEESGGVYAINVQTLHLTVARITNHEVYRLVSDR